MRRGAERDDDFRAAQARHFAAADAGHFEWQVAGPGFAAHERALLAPVAAAFASPYLEVGCGEGANFVHVGGDVEPNGANPLVAVQGRLVQAERGLRTSRRAALEAYLAAQPLTDVRLEMQQALPLRRLVLHHRFGLPRLGRVSAVTRALDLLERAAAAALPAGRWSYFVFSARRAGAV